MKTMKMVATMMFVLGVTVLAQAAATMPSAVQAMPGQVNYQGVLQEPTRGTLYTNGIYTLEFRLYTQQSGGTPLWGGSYQTYVKDGYFNVMLGDTAQALTDKPKYGPTELWKAMWLANDSSNKQLYLGVTPRQDYRNAVISSPTEISPRQRLLAAPYAFRAERAAVADASSGDFTVPGKLVVKGTLEANQSGITLNHIASDASSLTLGESKTSPSTTKLQGGTVYVNANNGLNVTPGGDAMVTMGSGRNLTVKGGYVSVDAGSVNIQSTTQAILTGSGGTFNSYNGYCDMTSADGNSYVRVIGSSLYAEAANLAVLGSSTGDVELRASRGRVIGDGDLWWRKSGSAIRPFIVTSVTVTTNNKAFGGYLKDLALSGVSSSLVDRWNWMVVGFESQDALKACQVTGTSASPYLNVISSSQNITTVKVQLLGVVRDISANVR